MKRDFLLDKKCKVTYQSGFVLEGTIRDVGEAGFIFETDYQTSFISWHSVRDVRVME